MQGMDQMDTGSSSQEGKTVHLGKGWFNGGRKDHGFGSEMVSEQLS